MTTLMPVGLEVWEVVMIAAMCAVTVLSVFTTLAVTVAYFATRERAAAPAAAPAHATVAAPTFTPTPVAG